LIYQILKLDPEANVKPLSILRRQIFIIRILGLFSDDATASIVVHAESSSTVRQIICQALTNAGKSGENPDDYILFEESAPLTLNSPSPSFALPQCSTTTTTTVDGPAFTLSNEQQQGGGGVATMISGEQQQQQQRILPNNEPILDAVACWNGTARRFHLRKKNTVN
jgi:hypothetical protein